MIARSDKDLENAAPALLLGLLSRGFKALFEEKHLYQSLDIAADDELLREVVARLRPEVPPAAMLLGSKAGRPSVPTPPDPEGDVARICAWARVILCTQPWGALSVGGSAQGQTAAARAGEAGLLFRVDTIRSYCSKCRERNPYNLMWVQEVADSHPEEKGGLSATGKMTQVFTFNFQCQSCKGFPEVFLVHRFGSKIVLSGRVPIEEVCVPRFIPKASAGYFSDAIVATQSGKTLAGLFFLRVLIEQFACSAPDTAGLLADQAIDRYMASLPVDFKDNFPSLKDVYSKLSEALHRAKADDALFQESIENIEHHFDARRVRRLRDWGTGQR